MMNLSVRHNLFNFIKSVKENIIVMSIMDKFLMLIRNLSPMVWEFSYNLRSKLCKSELLNTEKKMEFKELF